MQRQELLAQLKDQYASSTMLQYLLPVIPAILLLYLAVTTFDQAAPLQAESRHLQQQQSRLATLQASADWSALVERERHNEQRLQGRIWQAESVELGTADVQTTLNELAREKIRALRVRFAEPLWLAETGAWQLSAELSGRVQAGQVQGLMSELSRQRPQLRIDLFSYAAERSGLITIQVSALLTGPPPGNDQGDAQ
jgi:hypothetical protein